MCFFKTGQYESFVKLFWSCFVFKKNNFVREQAKLHHILSSCSTIEIAICMKGSNWVGANWNFVGVNLSIIFDWWYSILQNHVVKNIEQEDMRYNEIGLLYVFKDRFYYGFKFLYTLETFERWSHGWWGHQHLTFPKHIVVNGRMLSRQCGMAWDIDLYT